MRTCIYQELGVTLACLQYMLHVTVVTDVWLAVFAVVKSLLSSVS